MILPGGLCSAVTRWAPASALLGSPGRTNPSRTRANTLLPALVHADVDQRAPAGSSRSSPPLSHRPLPHRSGRSSAVGKGHACDRARPAPRSRNFPTGGRIFGAVMWTARQVAAEAGIAPASGRDLVRALGLAAVDRDMETGAKLYDPVQARAALAARPGRGRRTDLGKLNRSFTAQELQEVGYWEERARWALDQADALGEGQAPAVLRSVAAGLRRLVEAARRFPLFATHPDWGNDHRRVYNLAPDLGRQLLALAVQAHHRGEQHPLLWEELTALHTRFEELVDLASTGSPLPQRGDQHECDH